MDALLTKTEPAVQASTINGSEALLSCLVEEGVDTLFGYPGGAIMPVYDALLQHFSDSLNHILVRHEQGAIHAAQGFARASGRTGVVLVTSGPGATNLVTGLADALIDSTPVVCITGQVAEHLLGTDAFQETDVVNLTLPVTKWNVQITEAADIPAAVAKAFYIARTGRPGPVLIDITKNAQLEMTKPFAYSRCEHVRTYRPTPVLNSDEVARAAELIGKAKKPLLLAGQGVLLSGGSEALRQFVEKTGIPVASTLLGLSCLPTDHPLYVGFLGMHGNYAPNLLTNECDVLIAVGMRFDDRVTGNVSKYARQAKVIHIDIDRGEINKIIPADVAVCADAREALVALTALAKPGSHSSWLKEFALLHEVESEKIILKEFYPESEQLRMGEVIHELAVQTKGNAVLVTDVGQHQMTASRYFPFRYPRTNITSGGLGTMGFSVPAAMGACLSHPGRPVVCVVGDGGFQMTLQELGTIRQYDIPVKILILNNTFLGMVRQWQQLFFAGRYSFTELRNPDFVKLASAYGITGFKAVHRNTLSSTVRDWLSTTGPALLEVVVEKEENVFPMVPAGAGISDVLLAPPESKPV
jgi:acetolactate synthase-1/2/3 large subunit